MKLFWKKWISWKYQWSAKKNGKNKSRKTQFVSALFAHKCTTISVSYLSGFNFLVSLSLPFFPIFSSQEIWFSFLFFFFCSLYYKIFRIVCSLAEYVFAAVAAIMITIVASTMLSQCQQILFNNNRECGTTSIKTKWRKKRFFSSLFRSFLFSLLFIFSFYFLCLEVSTNTWEILTSKCLYLVVRSVFRSNSIWCDLKIRFENPLQNNDS